MEPIFDAPNTVKAVEVLFFEEAEVSKMRGGKPSFAASGHLSVLYIAHFHRFVLQLNDWRYPLLRRLNITNGGNGSYTLPGPNGSTFDLRITKPGSALANLDIILHGTRKLEASPEDNLVRSKRQADTGVKEVITETIKQVVHKVENKVATMKTGTKGLTSTKKRSNVKDIKERDFRKDARSKLNKQFFENNDKLTMEFNRRRRDNLNLGHIKNFNDLMKTSESHAAVFHIPQSDLVEAILSNKEIEQPKTEIKGRERLPEVQHVEKTPIVEGMTHYQG